jgi:hypothetical protein
MGICCAQNNNLSAKKQPEEVFEDVLQKSAKLTQDKNSKPIELTNRNRDNEIYNERSKLLLSYNSKINVRVRLSGRIDGMN